METIELDHLTVDYRAVRALDDVGFPIEKGGITMLAGPNGAGKSTVIRVLLGLVRPARGRLVVDGKPAGVTNAWKERLGYLPEAVAFAENLSGRQVLAFFARARGVPKQRIEVVLDRIGLSEAATRKVRGYSRGMRQRLGLGIAILADPEFLILDEPTGGLDQEGLTVLWDILREWREKDRFVLLSSHDLTLMEQRVSRICLLKQGQLCALGTPEELRFMTRLPIRVKFQLDAASEEAPIFVDDVHNWGQVICLDHRDNHLSVEIEPDDLLSLMDIRNRNAAAVKRIRVEEPGLDLVYDSLLKKAG
ncbi:ABC transporter ATP-binding protein [Sulfidibacter corallicola]|uniref:ABC transporter ATP-binding protein n=1 Tax=Sulfidibacter corallicola TaxID=2818388 RepID=A0A8A4TLM3_SULCO|nr:ABC transporter ATP-binding protein [Sulfidibacter corallicola]QTD50450.1 ABC transporter ATP-binding protein [Sulfidibacter corallicola]